ncbi:MAG TPA: type II toxin-antitoxin system VapC family toxin [bacterium]|nr:type II toxin-antitoxin system VapC family toxin [bacterium]
MKAYFDASVILRIILGDSARLKGWEKLEERVTSDLAEVESLRTLDRMQITGVLDEEEVIVRRVALYDFLRTMKSIQISPPILQRAAAPLPMVLGTLDAIHLATALSWRDEMEPELAFATHDKALGRAALAFGFKTLGV